MPDLEKKIAGWRARLQAELPHQGETVRELETHLRDDIETLRRAGVAPDAAFDQAARRLGDSRAIADEFSRLQLPWVPRWRPALVVLAHLAVLLAAVFYLAVASLLAGRFTPLVATQLLAVSSSYLVIFATGLIAAWALITWRRPLGERERLELRQLIFRLTILSSACLSLGMLVELLHFWAGHTPDRAWRWTPVNTGAAFVLLSAALLLVVQLRMKLDDRVRYVLVILGAPVLAFGWVVANALTSTVPITWLCAAFTASQIAVLMLRSPAGRIPVPPPEQSSAA